MRARQLSFRLASRAGDGSDPAFSHLCLLPALPDRRAWAPLSWTGQLTPGVSVAWLSATVPGCAGWIRLHKRPNCMPRLLFRIRLLPSKPLRSVAVEPPRPLLFYADCSSPPQQDGVPRSSPSFPNRGGTKHGAPPARVESTGDCLGNSSRLGSPRQSAYRGICAVYFAHFHRRGLPISSFFLLLLEDFGL